MKTYRVRLTTEERQTLDALVKKGRAAARTLTRARVLLKADEGIDGADGQGGPGWTDGAIGVALDVSAGTVERLRKRAVLEGALVALQSRPSTAVPRRKLDGRQEAQLVALSCSVAPEGRAGWSLRFLAEKMVELEYVDCLSYETVRRVLKKTSSSRGSKSSGSSRRRRTRRSSPAWRMCSMSMSGPMTPRGR